MYVSAGKHIMVTAQPGATSVSLARFEPGKPDERKEVSMRVVEVIRAANELGANYPDILQLLTDASKQKNMETPVAADKLPAAGRAYYRPVGAVAPGGRKAVKIGKDRLAPGSFPQIDDPTDAARQKEQSDRDAKSDGANGSMANVPVVPVAKETESDAEMGTEKGKQTKSTKKSDKPKMTRSWFGGSK